MPVIINGTTGLSGVSTVNLANGSVTQNILANGVAGTGPAFSAYRTTAQTVTGGVNTKVLLPVEDFDTNNCYDTTNSRFTPNVAGYYQVNAAAQNSAAGTGILPFIQKNGALYKYGQYTSTAGNTINTLSMIVYLNGSTDYIEFYVNFTATADLSSNCYFQAALVRAA